MQSHPDPPRRQFSLFELFVVVTTFAVWCLVARFHLVSWIGFTVMFTGPAIYFLGQRWQLYWLEFAGVAVTFIAPLGAALLMARLATLSGE